MFVNVPLQTAMGVAAQVLSRFAQVLALFLPLKIIIMLSTHHVSGKLQEFVSVDNLNAWLISFSIATFIMYAMSIFLTTAGNRTITKGVDQLLQERVDINKEGKKKLRRSYTTYCYAASDAAVFLLGALTLTFVNPLVLIGMMLVILAEIIATSIILNTKTGGFIGWVREGVGRNVKAYLQYLSAANFLALFLLIIADYFLQGEINAYIAILTMILGRLTFNSLAKFVKRLLAIGGDDEEEE
jgi:hypothetical protein